MPKPATNAKRSAIMKPMGTSVGLGIEMDAGKLKRELRENAGLMVTVAGAAGFGSVVAFAADAREMLCEHPASSLLLAAAAALLGYSAARIVAVSGTRARRRKTNDRLSAVFLGMSRRRKGLVSRALDEGSVSLSPFDADALALCELGIFGMPPVCSMLSATDFSVQPAVIRAIAEHRAEWLGL